MAQLQALELVPLATATTADAIEAIQHARATGQPFSVAIVEAEESSALSQLQATNQPHALGIVVTTAGHRWAELQKSLGGQFVACLVKPLVRTSHLVSALAAACRIPSDQSTPRIAPAPVPAPVVASAAIAEETSKGGATRNTRFRVLVAEDNLTNQILARRFLEDLGCQVDVASNGQLAIERTRETRYDVVFMDCHMPDMDGFTATETIRRDEEARGVERGSSANAPARLPILALTASAFEEDRQKAREAGMDDFIAKPVTKLELRRALDKWAARQERISM